MFSGREAGLRKSNVVSSHLSSNVLSPPALSCEGYYDFVAACKQQTCNNNAIIESIITILMMTRVYEFRGTQSDLRFCENKGLKLFKINEKWGQLDRKLRRKLIQNA